MDIEEFREVGHRVVDLIGDYLEGIEDRPLFPTVEPVELKEFFAEPLPQNPIPAEEVIRELEKKLLPYCTHVNHLDILAI